MAMMLRNARNGTSVRRWATCELSKTSILSSSIFASQRLDSNNEKKVRCASSSVDMSVRIGMTPEQRKKFYEMGFVDERALVRFDTLHEMQSRSCQVFAKKNLFGTYSAESKKFEWMTFEEFGKKVDTCRAALKDLGLQSYDKVAIISNNRWEWAAIASAAYSLNAHLVPMYEAQLPSDWTYILNDSEAKVLFTANDEILKMVRREVLPNTPKVTATLSLGAYDGQAHAFATIMSSAQPDTDGKLVIKPTPEDLANLIYTSGTTGKPKGVELTHSNFSTNVKAAARSMVEDLHDFILHDDCSLAFLPWAHSYGQTCELWMSMAHGSAMGVSRGISHILEDLQLVRPTVLFSVPTLYKKIYDGVNNMVETSSPLKQRLMRRALELGQQKSEARLGNRAPLGMFENMQYNMLDSIVLKKIRDRFGGRLRHGFAAGAATPVEVIRFMDSIGIPVCEGYGLTETSPIITINTPEQRHIGSVGRPIGDVTVYIVDEDGNEVPRGVEGEVCCVGPNVMKGYYKNDAATAEVITVAPDGKSRMFHTGDLGKQEADGFVRITGRLKEQYKLENGKYVVPTPIEDAICLSRFISQAVLTGANRVYNVVLLVPEWNVIRTELKIDPKITEEELANDSRVKQLIDDEILSACSRLKKYEMPQKWAFVAPFTAANSMLTPKMSIRRHKVIHHYADVISSLYGDDANTAIAESADAQGAKEHADPQPEQKAA